MICLCILLQFLTLGRIEVGSRAQESGPERCRSHDMKQPLTQQRELRATKHRPFHQFEFVDLGLDGSITVALRQTRQNGVVILENARGKTLQLGDLAGLHGLQPGAQLVSVAMAQHMDKRLDQAVRGVRHSTRATNEGHAFRFLSR